MSKSLWGGRVAARICGKYGLEEQRDHALWGWATGGTVGLCRLQEIPDKETNRHFFFFISFHNVDEVHTEYFDPLSLLACRLHHMEVESGKLLDFTQESGYGFYSADAEKSGKGGKESKEKQRADCFSLQAYTWSEAVSRNN